MCADDALVVDSQSYSPLRVLPLRKDGDGQDPEEALHVQLRAVREFAAHGIADDVIGLVGVDLAVDDCSQNVGF